MVSMMLVYYLGIKAAFFYGLVHSFIKFDTLQKHWLFLSLLYTAGVAMLSWVFIMAPTDAPNWREWGIWLAKTFVLIAVYFRLLARFDEGILFWILLVAGIAVVWY
jgi:hypothetical protein